MKIICFTCRKLVKEMNKNYHTFLVEVDNECLHKCMDCTPETTRDIDDESREMLLGIHMPPVPLEMQAA